MRVKDKSIIVTGAAGGIGEGIARRLARLFTPAAGTQPGTRESANWPTASLIVALRIAVLRLTARK